MISFILMHKVSDFFGYRENYSLELKIKPTLTLATVS